MVIKCGICTKEFYGKPSHVARGNSKYCSKNCFDIWQRANKKLGNKSQRWNSVKRVCKVCSKEFYHCPAKIALKRGIYCSKACYNKGMIGLGKGRKLSKETIAKFSGKNHYNWRGGITPESHTRLKTEEWKRVRSEVYKRDKWICQKCFKLCTYKNIACHHIEAWHISKNNNIDNLITLCNSCHAKTDGFRLKLSPS